MFTHILLTEVMTNLTDHLCGEHNSFYVKLREKTFKIIIGTNCVHYVLAKESVCG